MTNTQVRVKSREQKFFILDIDGNTNSEEVAEAITRKTGIEQQHFELRAMSTSQSGNQSATVAVQQKRGGKLLESTKIKISWSTCRVKLKFQLTRCYRCLGFRHWTAVCTGPDRSKNCMNCDCTGNQAKLCSEEPQCFNCNEKKNRMDNTGCPKYRELLE
ncbi:unnamed protein product [Ceutorhynchus assimilis]|uniref:Gag-like protein n=1 Tax=Ceutorhynchus assimilis TaxID=467358 RepID=A0A9N9MA38_9CUCU|nr:unnamed protein product [Ceutorhynchus assimilis]